MNKKVLFFTTLSIAIVSLVCLLFFRITPTSKIWKDYTVLYVEKSIAIETVLELLETNDIHNVISQNHEDYPVPSQFAPVQFHKFSNGITHDDLQNAYFSDKNNKFNLFYIPNKFSANISNCFENVNMQWGINNHSSTTPIPFILTTIFFLTLIIAAKNKVVFFATQLPFILLSISIPFYHTTACICALIFSYFLIEKFRNRIGYKQKLPKNYSFHVFIVLTLIIMIITGIKAMFLFIIACSASFSIDTLCSFVAEERKKKLFFVPIPIHTVKTIPQKEKQLQLTVLSTFCTIAILTLFALFNPTTGSTSNSNIELPTPQNTTNTFSEKSYIQTISTEAINRLPDLTDYISTAWYYEMYPYMRLHNSETDVVYPGESITTTEYVKTENVIKEEIKTIAEFNNDYIEKAIEIIHSLSNSGAEKLLSSENGFTRVLYKNTTAIKQPTGSLIIMISICVYYILVYIYINRKRV